MVQAYIRDKMVSGDFSPISDIMLVHPFLPQKSNIASTLDRKAILKTLIQSTLFL